MQRRPQLADRPQHPQFSALGPLKKLGWTVTVVFGSILAAFVLLGAIDAAADMGEAEV
jgi:hypothetical protein